MIVQRFVEHQSRNHDGVLVGHLDDFWNRGVWQEHQHRHVFGGKCVGQRQLENVRCCDVIGQTERTCSHVKPIWVIWGELLLRTSLDGVDPSWDLELTRAFEMGRVGFDERLGAEVVG